MRVRGLLTIFIRLYTIFHLMKHNFLSLFIRHKITVDSRIDIFCSIEVNCESFNYNHKRRLFVIELIDIISLNYIVIMSHLASEIFKRSLVTPVTTAKFMVKFSERSKGKGYYYYVYDAISSFGFFIMS
ncbi:hypothetical protein RCL_jg27686.t1 [Rhizophagus clarus]|uniref:Uncharacterized protein n=1 Tax=Rhizophagus clarus TaxID=94130 RepID=A0A8H3QFQ2_9GLOM|nr:hypothetical protein RCL_jg27686.t1 [Rhizophagus clarus]